MFFNSKRVIVGLTTYYNENLMISLSGLSRFGKGAILIIHNDNPDTKITRRQIKDMGYKGRLYIINSSHNIGLLNSRLAIIDFVKQHRIAAGWFIFVDDDDILLNLDIPKIKSNHFAIIQNMAVIRTRLRDVLCAMMHPKDIQIDNQNIYMVRPHIGLAGTLVRTVHMIRLADVLHFAQTGLSDVIEGLNFRPPTDMIMWSALNIVAHNGASDSTPIYMDTVNYIATDLDTVSQKYGMPILPENNINDKIMAIIAKCDTVIHSAVADMSKDATLSSHQTDSE